MGTGLFINRTRGNRGPSIDLIAKRKAQRAADLAALRDMAADQDIPVSEAARNLGLSTRHAVTLWNQVKREVETWELMLCK